MFGGPRECLLGLFFGQFVERGGDLRVPFYELPIVIGETEKASYRTLVLRSWPVLYVVDAFARNVEAIFRDNTR